MRVEACTTTSAWVLPPVQDAFCSRQFAGYFPESRPSGWSMAIFLDEDMIGSDPTMIGFPHLVLCMGVVVLMRDGSLIGAHFTNPSTEHSVLLGLRRSIGINGSGMDQLYCMADMAEHIQKYGGLDITGKANAIGFTGKGYVADFGVLNPTNGTYAQVTTNGAGKRATVRCKLNEHMDYAPGAGPSVTKVSRMDLPMNMKVGDVGFRKLVSGKTTTISATPKLQGAASPDLNTPFLKEVVII